MSKIRKSGGYRQDRSDSTDWTDLSDHERWSHYSRWLDSDDGAIRAKHRVNNK
ncbi:hypothetical protein [Neorhodopirellula pilleata]|uniref:hypothetical protein n=1 Tax=Neorhodopirellula pilleata TaxID=2714738 RepID=UPI0018CC9754|nr:hypothetical protein [Neorhodopirellula pilleata]